MNSSRWRQLQFLIAPRRNRSFSTPAAATESCNRSNPPSLSGSEEEGELEVQDETRVRETESVVVNIRLRRSVSLDSSSVANFNLVLANVQSSVQSGENEGIVSKRFIAGNENFPTTSDSKRSSSFRTRYLHRISLRSY
ncbi:hypothetical protein Lal_00023674 [Lupinus albus]|nr:hypothetical protein Lal_00023674 [Lupinus albus]